LIKRRLKALAAGVFANKYGAALLRPVWRGRSVVFLLHRLGEDDESADSISLKAIAKSLRTLRMAGARFVSLAYLFELASRGVEPEPGCVAFTIDDGYADQGILAKEAFAKNDCPVTVFLITGLIDGTLWPWDDKVAYSIDNSSLEALKFAPTDDTFRLSTAEQRATAVVTVQNYCKSVPWPEAECALEHLYAMAGCYPPDLPPRGYKPLTWDEVRTLEAAGVDFAPHSVTHRITSKITADAAFAEISGSWNRLKHELAHPVPIYAWPTGRSEDFGTRDMKIAASAGMLGAVSATNDYARFGRRDPGRAEKFAVSRFAMSKSTEDILQYGIGLERVKQLLRFNP
jgi:peptidoglycan/xylan/chitin deacetylase (PgdA/CDA1 family)